MERDILQQQRYGLELATSESSIRRAATLT